MNAIVERANKEVNRHLRAYTFDRAIVDDWQMLVPFVQRYMNSSVSDSGSIYSGSIKGISSEMTTYLFIGTLNSCVLFRAILYAKVAKQDLDAFSQLLKLPCLTNSRLEYKNGCL